MEIGKNFMEEIKAAVSGRWDKRKKTKPRKQNKTPEEIYKEVVINEQTNTKNPTLN